MSYLTFPKDPFNLNPWIGDNPWRDTNPFPSEFTTRIMTMPASNNVNAAQYSAYTTNDGVVYEVIMPGYAQDDISLEIKDGDLHIVASRDDSISDEWKSSENTNMDWGHFPRRMVDMTIPSLIRDLQNYDITSKFDNGLLHIFMREKEEVKESKKITIKKA